MRDRDQWEQWLRTEITSLPPAKGVDTVTAWAVASMMATYANADGSGITVSTDTIRKTLKIGKSKLDLTIKWLEDSGVLTTTAKHGRGTPTRRALVIPPIKPSDERTTQGSPVKARDERTAQGSPIKPSDERTTQGSPVNPGLIGRVTSLNGPVTSFERTSNPVRDPFDRTALGSPQPVKITKEIPGGGPPARPPEDPPAAEPPGPEPSRRCAEHVDGDPGYPCRWCKDARLDWERWKRALDRQDAERPALPPECGQCDARPGDLPSARMVNSGGRWLKCPRCHPESLALSRPSTTDIQPPGEPRE
jgi:hypothetical protein